MKKHLSILILLSLFMFQVPIAYSYTEIAGTVIAKKDDSVKVEFEFHGEASPKEEDNVTFFTKLDEIQVGVGSGRIVSIDTEGIWVEVIDNNPLPGMQAVVQATGKSDLYSYLKLQFAKFKENEDPNILAELQRYATEGDSNAQNMVGIIYFYSFGKVTKDMVEAFKWFKKAAKQGHVRGQLNLGHMYLNGDGTEHNEVKAYYWYKKAAEQGESQGQYNIGEAYFYGYGGFPINKTLSIQWFEKSAKQGYPNAQAYMGWAYEGNGGIAANKTLAISWYQKAAKQGHPNAQAYMGWAYEGNGGIAANKTLAISWYQKSAAQNNLYAKEALKRLNTSQ